MCFVFFLWFLSVVYVFVICSFAVCNLSSLFFFFFFFFFCNTEKKSLRLKAIFEKEKSAERHEAELSEMESRLTKQKELKKKNLKKK